MRVAVVLILLFRCGAGHVSKSVHKLRGLNRSPRSAAASTCVNHTILLAVGHCVPLPLSEWSDDLTGGELVVW